MNRPVHDQRVGYKELRCNNQTRGGRTQTDGSRKRQQQQQLRAEQHVCPTPTALTLSNASSTSGNTLAMLAGAKRRTIVIVRSHTASGSARARFSSRRKSSDCLGPGVQQ